MFAWWFFVRESSQKNQKSCKGLAMKKLYLLFALAGLILLGNGCATGSSRGESASVTRTYAVPGGSYEDPVQFGPEALDRESALPGF